MLSFPGHFFGAYIFLKIFSRIRKIKYSERIMFWSTIVAIAVDFDSLAYPFLGIPPYYHRRYVVHTPFFWIIAFLLFATFLKIIDRRSGKKRTFIVLPFAVAVLSHLVLDSTFEGIMWFYPVTATLYGLNLPILSARPLGEWVISYLTNPYGLFLELFVAFLGLRVAQVSGDLKIFFQRAQVKNLGPTIRSLFRSR